MGMIRTNHYLPSEMLKELARWAVEFGTTISEIIRQACREWLDRRGQEKGDFLEAT